MKRDSVFIEHILHEIKYIEEKCQHKTLDDLYSDVDLQHIVSRALEIIGEASRNVSMAIKDGYPDIPWKEMIGVRDRIIHSYFSINWVIVWDIVTNELFTLKNQLEDVLSEIEE